MLDANRMVTIRRFASDALRDDGMYSQIELPSVDDPLVGAGRIELIDDNVSVQLGTALMH